MTIKDYTQSFVSSTNIYLRRELTFTVEDLFKGTLHELRKMTLINLEPKHFCIEEDTLIITV